MMMTMKSEFIDYIKSILPSHLSLEEFVASCQTPLRKSIRVNTLKISVEDFQDHVLPQGWILHPIPWCPEGFWIERTDSTIPLGSTVEHLAGLFYIQEASSMLPPQALFADIESPSLVLDMAAAPGSKTTQMAGLMDNRGCLVANEYSASRIKSLHANVQRLGVRNVALTHFDAHVFGHYCEASFDAILLDAPCGGEGTIRKDDTALDDWSMQHIESVSAIQFKLIQSAFRALKVGGHLIYSTCTLNTIENQQVCYALKEAFPDAVEFCSLAELFDGADQSLTEEGFLHIWPQIYDSEGFFVAKIRKTREVESAPDLVKRIKSSAFKPAARKVIQDLDAYYLQHFGVKPSEYGTVMCRDQEFWLFPFDFSDIAQHVRYDRVGIRLGQQFKKGFRAHHDAMIALPLLTSKMIELTAEQAQTYLKGQDLVYNSEDFLGECCVSFQGYPLGLVKILTHKLKNNLPRHLVKDNMIIN